MPLSFDFATERIHTLDDAVSAQTLINGCRDAEASSVGIAYPQIASGEGKAPLGGAETGIVVKLLSGWKILSDKTAGLLSVSGGSVVRHDATSIFAANPLVQYENVLSQSGVRVQGESEEVFRLAFAALASPGMKVPPREFAMPRRRIKIQKDPEEIRPFVLSWEGDLLNGRQIDVASAICVVEEASDGDILGGIAVVHSILSPVMTVTIGGGKDGVDYTIKCTVEDDGVAPDKYKYVSRIDVMVRII